MDRNESLRIARIFEPNTPEAGHGELSGSVEYILMAAKRNRSLNTGEQELSLEEAIKDAIVDGARSGGPWTRSRRFFGAAALAASNIETRELDYEVVNGLVGGLAETIIGDEPYEAGKELAERDKISRFDHFINLLDQTQGYAPLPEHIEQLVIQAQEAHLDFLAQILDDTSREIVWRHSMWVAEDSNPVHSHSARSKAIKLAAVASERDLEKAAAFSHTMFAYRNDYFFRELRNVGYKTNDASLLNEIIQVLKTRVELQPETTPFSVPDRSSFEYSLDRLISSKAGVLAASDAGLLTLGERMEEMAEREERSLNWLTIMPLPRRVGFIFDSIQALRDEKDRLELDKNGQPQDSEDLSSESIEKAEKLLKDWLYREIDSLQETSDPVIFTAIFEAVKKDAIASCKYSPKLFPEEASANAARELRGFMNLIYSPEVLAIGLAAIEQTIEKWQKEVSAKNEKNVEEFKAREEHIKSSLTLNPLKLMSSKRTRNDRQDVLASRLRWRDDVMCEAMDQDEREAKLNSAIENIGILIGDKITFLALTAQGRELAESFIKEWLFGLDTAYHYISDAATHALGDKQVEDQEAVSFLKRLANSRIFEIQPG